MTFQSPGRSSVLYLHWPLTPAKRPLPPVRRNVPSPEVPGSSERRSKRSSRVSSGENVATPSASNSSPDGVVFEKLAYLTDALVPSTNGRPLLRINVRVPFPPLAVTIESPI